MSELAITPNCDAGTLVLALAGELDLASVPVLRRRLDDALADEARRVVIDLGGLEFLDCAGLGLLLSARLRLHELGRELCLRRARPAVRRLFELTETVGMLGLEG